SQSVKNDLLEKPAPDKGSVQSVKNDLLASLSRVSKHPGVDDLNLHINTRSTSLGKKEKDIINTSTDVEGYLVSFEKFYSVYPRKKGKQDAVKWFKKEKPSIEFVSMLIEDVNKRLATEWKGKEPQYLPYPATYLNGKRWEDGIDVPIAQQNHDKEQKERLMREAIAREEREEAAKQRERQESKGGIAKLTSTGGYKEAQEKANKEMKELGMTPREYYAYIHKKLNQGRMPEDNI
ncbi:MAG: hypothetical protein KW793_05040, partial [Candidatus Doudnabacteria bacterium]|nr:hypothetical protein [Candidatus Doudnabacteria bacterium]